MDTTDLQRSIHEALDLAGASIVVVDGRRGYPLSGLVWSDTLVLTTSRAVRREGVTVVSADGATHAAEPIGRDPGTDLALVRLADATSLPPARWAAEDSLKVGQIVVRAARTRDGLQATLGIVSVYGGPWRSPEGASLERTLASDAAPFRGYSGGPLLTLAGEVAGLSSSAFERQLPLAVPHATVRRVVAELEAHGRIRRGYLGVAGQPIRLPPDQAEASGQRVGLMLISVESGSPAEAAGLALGDVLLAIDGAEARHPGALLALLDERTIGRTLAVNYLRGGEVAETKVTVGERP